jgi:hypothetical protein
MNPYAISLLALIVVFGASLVGIALQRFLPTDHHKDGTKESVRIGMGMVATMSALILGILVASAKGSYDAEKAEVIQLGAKITYLDRVLVNYGPEAKPVRVLLRQAVSGAIDRMWAEDMDGSQLDPGSVWSEALPKALQALTPTTDEQRAFKAQAASLSLDLGQMRWLLYEQADSSISHPLLIVVVSWLALIMGSVGLFAPRNATAVIALFLASISVSGALFLILELDRPFDGLIRISRRPLVNSLIHLNDTRLHQEPVP